MNKKILITIGALVILALAYWLLSPFWRNLTLNEELPGSAESIINDNLLSMDSETRVNFEKQTEEMKDSIMKKNDNMPANQLIIVDRAEMVARAHDVEGTAFFIKSGNETYLRFENLKTINGPDLRIYLSSDLSADDIVDLGPIRATEGNVNYIVPSGIDLNKYKIVMIWCRAFSVLFSYAQFSN